MCILHYLKDTCLSLSSDCKWSSSTFSSKASSSSLSFMFSRALAWNYNCSCKQKSRHFSSRLYSVCVHSEISKQHAHICITWKNTLAGDHIQLLPLGAADSLPTWLATLADWLSSKFWPWVGGLDCCKATASLRSDHMPEQWAGVRSMGVFKLLFLMSTDAPCSATISIETYEGEIFEAEKFQVVTFFRGRIFAIN